MMYLEPILNVLNNYLGRNRVGIGYATKTLLIGCKLLKLIFNFGRFVLNIFFIYMILQIEVLGGHDLVPRNFGEGLCRIRQTTLDQVIRLLNSAKFD